MWVIAPRSSVCGGRPDFRQTKSPHLLTYRQLINAHPFPVHFVVKLKTNFKACILTGFTYEFLSSHYSGARGYQSCGSKQGLASITVVVVVTYALWIWPCCQYVAIFIMYKRTIDWYILFLPLSLQWVPMLPSLCKWQVTYVQHNIMFTSLVCGMGTSPRAVPPSGTKWN